MNTVIGAKEVSKHEAADFLTAELLRYRLDAIVAEGGLAIERTAISPIVTSAKDYSCTLLDPAGRLVAGGGKIAMHFYGACKAVAATLTKYGSTVAAGDMFLANDPHHDCGMHPQDVYILLPVFVRDELIGWMASSAHMLDMGGMSRGSYAPDATECFQEAIRFPPVRLSKAGVEQTDVWEILLNNVRIPDIVEMDMRSLVAGCHAGAIELSRIVTELGNAQYLAAIEELALRVRNEIRRRIDLLEPGAYHAESWIEWKNETYRIPCTLTVGDGKFKFDYEGASPQMTHFINSKEYLVMTHLGATTIWPHFAVGLPYNDGLLACVEVHCPVGSIVNCTVPAPIGSGHNDVPFAAAEAGMRAIMMAVEASENSPTRPYLSAPTPGSGFTAQIWGGIGFNGRPVYWTMSEALSMGVAASAARDGTDLGVFQLGQASTLEFPDVEVWESWYPWNIVCKNLLTNGRDGAGCKRAGGRLEIIYEPADGQVLGGNAFGNRQRVPAVGMAGGYPGAPMETFILREDGTRENVPPQAQDLTLRPGDRFVCRNGGGGGWGDPLDRTREEVEADVHNKRLTVEEAANDYGVIVGDAERTKLRRAKMLKDRLARAVSAVKPLDPSAVPAGWHDVHDRHPLATGVVQEGGVAVSERSGALLAVTPDHWTDGCPRIRNFLPAGADVEIVAYLDPVTGHALFVDVVALGTERSFTSAPKRWANWTPKKRA